MKAVSARALALAYGALLGIALALGAPLAWWFLTPSERYLEPVSIAYFPAPGGRCGPSLSPSGWCAEFIRRTPRGPVRAEWATEIEIAGTPLECNASGVATYQGAEADRVTFSVSEQIASCLAAEGQKIVIHKHRVILGPFTLRPAAPPAVVIR
jgi:hypothetical protein